MFKKILFVIVVSFLTISASFAVNLSDENVSRLTIGASLAEVETILEGKPVSTSLQGKAKAIVWNSDFTGLDANGGSNMRSLTAEFVNGKLKSVLHTFNIDLSDADVGRLMLPNR